MGRCGLVKDRSGFTVIELILTVLIISLMANVTLLAVDYSDPALELDRRLVLSHLRLAQAKAMATKQNHGFRVLGTGSYEVYQNTAGNPITNPATGSPLQENLDTGISFASTSYEVVFNTEGIPLLTSNLTITLQKESSSKNILVLFETGALILN